MTLQDKSKAAKIRTKRKNAVLESSNSFDQAGVKGTFWNGKRGRLLHAVVRYRFLIRYGYVNPPVLVYDVAQLARKLQKH